MLTLDLVTPEKTLASIEVDMAVISGTDGEFGVLEKHAPLISTIKPGVINLYKNDAISNRIFVTGGFAEVTPERCTVLATEAYDIDKFSKSEAEQLVYNAKEQLAISVSDEDKSLLEEEIELLNQLVAVYK